MHTSPAVRTTHVPGEIGIWLFILGDAVLFSLLFGLFLYYRAGDPELFAASRTELSLGLGLLNTVLLLSSSWCVASALRAARAEAGVLAAHCLWAAIACSVGFMVVKAFEYTPKISAGITLSTNDFFMFYFVYTGIHLIHVVIGTGVLIWMASYTASCPSSEAKIRNLESGASFWHLVDLLWIVLFALLYLIS